MSRAPPERQLTARAALAGIHVYQATLSRAFAASGVACRFSPTCSHYAEACVRRYGVVRGGGLALRRMLRCGPWTPSGTVDPPPTGSDPASYDPGRRRHEDLAALVVQQHPAGVGAERRAERQQRQVADGQPQRQQARPRAVLHQRAANPDVKSRPRQRRHGQHAHHHGGESRGHRRPGGHRPRHAGDGPGAAGQRQAGGPDDAEHGAPHAVELGQEVDVAPHSTATRTSTWAPSPLGCVRLKENLAPSATPAGTVTVRGYRSVA